MHIVVIYEHENKDMRHFSKYYTGGPLIMRIRIVLSSVWFYLVNQPKPYYASHIQTVIIGIRVVLF